MDEYLFEGTEQRETGMYSKQCEDNNNNSREKEIRLTSQNKFE